MFKKETQDMKIISSQSLLFLNKILLQLICLFFLFVDF
jgi:hypothetical protein